MIEFGFMDNSRYLLASKTKTVRLPTHKVTIFSAAENEWDGDQLGSGRDRKFIAMQGMETSSGAAIGETVNLYRDPHFVAYTS